MAQESQQDGDGNQRQPPHQHQDSPRRRVIQIVPCPIREQGQAAEQKPDQGQQPEAACAFRTHFFAPASQPRAEAHSFTAPRRRPARLDLSQRRYRTL